MDRTTRCQCGALRAKVTGEPVRVIICHCIDCQGRTGAAFSYNVRFERTQVQLEGTGCCYEREARGSRKIRNYFCPTCGTTVYWETGSLAHPLWHCSGFIRGEASPTAENFDLGGEYVRVGRSSSWNRALAKQRSDLQRQP